MKLTLKQRIKMKLTKYDLYYKLFPCPFSNPKNLENIDFECAKLYLQHQRYFSYIKQEFIDDIVNLEDNAKKLELTLKMSVYKKGKKHNHLPFRSELYLKCGHMAYAGNHESFMDMIYSLIEQVKSHADYEEKYGEIHRQIKLKEIQG